MSETPPVNREGYTLLLQDFKKKKKVVVFCLVSFCFSSTKGAYPTGELLSWVCRVSSVTLAAALSLAQQPLGDAYPFLSCCIVGFRAAEKTAWPCLLQIVGRSCRSENWHGCEIDLKQDDCFTCIHQSLLEGKRTRLLPAASDMQVISSADEIWGLSFIQFFLLRLSTALWVSWAEPWPSLGWCSTSTAETCPRLSESRGCPEPLRSLPPCDEWGGSRSPWL